MKKASESIQTSDTTSGKEATKNLLTFNLPHLIQQLKEEETWKKSGRGAKTLYKANTMRIVLNVMQAGAEIKTHQAAGPISVQVVAGRIKFLTEEETVELQQGEMLALKEFVKHSVEALEEAAFLLTVAPLQA